MADSKVPAFFMGARNRIANGVVPGRVFDTRGNYMGNGGRAALATVAKIGSGLLFGPLVSQAVDRGLSGWVNRGADYGIGKPVMEQVGIPGAPGASRAYTAPTPTQLTQNLGLGAQRPGGNWYGYTGGPGSMGSFGNTQFGNGMASIGQWNPQSVWGQQVAAPAGSNLDLGNNVGGFIGGGGNGGGGSGLSGSNVGYGSVAPSMGLTRGGGVAGGWQTASNWGQLLGRFGGDPEMYTQAI